MRKMNALAFLTALLVVTILAAAEDKPLLFQQPTLSKTEVVFAFGGDLWTVGRGGGEAVRLTTGMGTERDPFFSPDGSQVAFTGEYEGNTDVYVVSATGGVPRRLTYHPYEDAVVGWRPDGKRILFISQRLSMLPRLFTVSPQGGYPEELPLPSGFQASFSLEGTRLAYMPTVQWQKAWKRYRGGQTTPIWLVN
ncbi:MAG: protease, partial [Acidobacteriota bacterium]